MVGGGGGGGGISSASDHNSRPLRVLSASSLSSLLFYLSPLLFFFLLLSNPPSFAASASYISPVFLNYLTIVSLTFETYLYCFPSPKVRTRICRALSFLPLPCLGVSLQFSFCISELLLSLNTTVFFIVFQLRVISLV